MFNKKIFISCLFLGLSSAVIAQESDVLNSTPMTLGEALDLESKITRAKLQNALNKENGKDKELELQRKIDMVKQASEQLNSKSTISLPPELESIRGINGNLRAWLRMDGRRFVVKEGDFVNNWVVTKITDNNVQLKQGKKTVEITFSQALSNNNFTLQGPIKIPLEELLKDNSSSNYPPMIQAMPTTNTNEPLIEVPKITE